MSGAVHNPGQEFWQPPITQATKPEGMARMVEVCDRCGTEFVMSSRFCHVCGTGRGSQNRASVFSRVLQIQHIKEALGLGTPSLVAFILGIACVVAALFMGVIFTAPTMLDWQAIQLWRIEWLLGATAAFLAGILLKRTS